MKITKSQLKQIIKEEIEKGEMLYIADRVADAARDFPNEADIDITDLLENLDTDDKYTLMTMADEDAAYDLQVKGLEQIESELTEAGTDFFSVDEPRGEITFYKPVDN